MTERNFESISGADSARNYFISKFPEDLEVEVEKFMLDALALVPDHHVIYWANGELHEERMAKGKEGISRDRFGSLTGYRSETGWEQTPYNVGTLSMLYKHVIRLQRLKDGREVITDITQPDLFLPDRIRRFGSDYRNMVYAINDIIAGQDSNSFSKALRAVIQAMFGNEDWEEVLNQLVIDAQSFGDQLHEAANLLETAYDKLSFKRGFEG